MEDQRDLVLGEGCGGLNGRGGGGMFEKWDEQQNIMKIHQCSKIQEGIEDDGLHFWGCM